MLGFEKARRDAKEEPRDPAGAALFHADGVAVNCVSIADKLTRRRLSYRLMRIMYPYVLVAIHKLVGKSLIQPRNLCSGCLYLKFSVT